MKKVLFATTALIATAGMASAEVTLSGSGRLGLVYNGALSGVAGADTTKVEQRMTINIDGSGETDGGLSFGGRIRLRSDEGRPNTRVAEGNVYIGNDTWRITVGNTDGAMVNRVGYYQGTVGLTGLQWANVSMNIGTSSFTLNSYSSGGNAGDVVRLDFNVGDFGVSLSTDSTGDYLANGSEDAIAVSYNFGDWAVAAGYADDNGTSVWSLSAVGSIGDFGLGLGYTDKQLIGSKVTLSGSYNFGDTTVTAFVANTSEDTAGSAGIGAAGSDSEYGIGFAYSLGGATLKGGVSRNYTSETMADLGVSFKF